MFRGSNLDKWEIVYTKQSIKDAHKIVTSGLRRKVDDLLKIIEENPFKTPPPYKKLVGDLKGAYSRRINIRHRLVYQIYEEGKIIKVLSMWTHYE